MKKYLLITCIAIAYNLSSYAQTYMTRNGLIGFYSKMPLEDIKAENNQVYAVIDAGKKNLAFTLLVKGFLFEKALMQEHFNENYIESDKYPKAVFTGAYIGDVPVAKDGVYNVTIKGNLTMHGVTKPLEVAATIEVKAGKLLGRSSFKLKPEDYNITIPSVVRDKIAKEMSVTVQIDCNPK
jgi:hypothetical protein